MAAEAKREESRVIIRSIRREDLAAVQSIAQEAPGVALWSDQGFADAANGPEAVGIVSEVGGIISGFLFGRLVLDEAEILNLGVRSSRRRRGDGTALLTAVLDRFRPLGVTRVFLEVRESNETGLRFYAKNGFSVTGFRPTYYRDPTERAVLMERKLTG